MPGKKYPIDQWHQTSVFIRADIFLKAGEMGLDISNACNMALADLLGIDYQQQKLTGRATSDLAILDADTHIKEPKRTSQKTQAPDIHPVINADDPSAIAKVLKAKRQSLIKPVKEIHVLKDSSSQEKMVAHSLPAKENPPQVKGKSSVSGKKRKDDALKNFVAAKITRVDSDDAVITKDDLYQAFARWCRDHRITPIPERKMFATSLKNKLAFIEKTVNGTPCWINVRIR